MEVSCLGWTCSQAPYLSQLAPEGQHVHKVADKMLELRAAPAEGCRSHDNVFLLSPSAQHNLEGRSQAHDDGRAVLGRQGSHLLVGLRRQREGYVVRLP